MPEVMREPIIVSIATIPSRIGQLKQTLESLLNGALVPTKIFVNHPDYCELEKSGYVVPDFLNDEQFCRGIVERIVSPKDWGPGTKILGAARIMPAQGSLVIADDDVIYHPKFLSGLVEKQTEQPKFAFSY